MTKLLNYIPLLLLAGCSGSSDEIDLQQVLNVTVETIYAFEDANQGQAPEANQDQAFIEFGEDLEMNYNNAQPPIYPETISVVPQEDASLIAYVDKDADNTFSAADDALYKIEVDGENSRIIATSRSGAVGDQRISGSGLLTGLLIGSMLSRQRAAGVSSKGLASKKTRTTRQAARSRAGSGSHSRGK